MPGYSSFMSGPAADVGMPGYGSFMSGPAADVGMPGYGSFMSGPAADVGMPGYEASMQAQAEAQEADEAGGSLIGSGTEEDDTSRPQVTGDEQEMTDEEQDLSGLPTGMTAEQTNMIVAGLKHSEKGKRI